MQCLFLRHILPSQISLDFQLLFNDCNFLILLLCLSLSLPDSVPCLFLILGKIIIKILHILLQHGLRPLQPLLMQLGQLLKLVDLLPLMINQHLKEQRLPLLTNKLMHWLVNLHPILDSILRSLDKTSLGLIIRLILILFTELVQLTYCYTLLFYTFLPYLHFLVFLFLLALTLSFFLFHSENLWENMIVLLHHREYQKDFSILGPVDSSQPWAN